jgi:hypothetical protein
VIIVEPTKEERARLELDRLARQIREKRIQENEAVTTKNGAWAVQTARRRIALQERYDVLQAQLVRGVLV